MFKRVSDLGGEMTRVVMKAELFSIKQRIRRDICKLQHQRRQPQRLRHELRIVLVEQEKISVLHVRHVFYNNSASFSAKPQFEITTFPDPVWRSSIEYLYLSCLNVYTLQLSLWILIFYNSEILVPLALLLNSRQNIVLVNTYSVYNWISINPNTFR